MENIIHPLLYWDVDKLQHIKTVCWFVLFSY